MKQQFKGIFETEFIKAIEQVGGEVYLVGGCVRDTLLEITPKDIDLIVRLIPATQLQSLLAKHGNVKLVGESFGVYKFTPFNSVEEYDIALPRTDKKIAGAKGHKSIETQSDHMLTIIDDLGRRDFTINAIAIDRNYNIIDPFDGQEDLYKGIIRCVTEETFIEDPLRLMRAVQFAARFRFQLSEETMTLIANNRHLITEITAERILEEFKKVFDKTGDIAYFADLLDVTGLFSTYFGYKLQVKRLGPTKFLAELFFFGISDGTFYVSDFLKKKLGSALPIELYKEVRAFDVVYMTEFPTQDKVYQVIYDAIKQSDIVLRSDFITHIFVFPFIEGRFPKTRKEVAVSGDDLIELGYPQGQIHGIIMQDFLDNIFSGKLKNEKSELLTLLSKYPVA